MQRQKRAAMYIDVQNLVPTSRLHLGGLDGLAGQFLVTFQTDDVGEVQKLLIWGCCCVFLRYL